MTALPRLNIVDALVNPILESEARQRDIRRPIPGGGEFGRGARTDVRNPVLRLPAAQAILAMPVEQRRPLGILLRELADQANTEAERSRKRNKHMMFAYWKVASVYIKHIARAVDPISARKGLANMSRESEAREREAKKHAAPRTYSIVWDDYGYFDGWNVMCDQTQSMMRDEPYERERDAQELLDRLEGGDEDEGSE